jgi:hypothetical protein
VEAWGGWPFARLYMLLVALAFLVVWSKPGNDDLRAIFVAGLFGHGVKRITPWGGYADKIDCSPDGKRIVYSSPEFGEAGGGSHP